MPKVIVKHKKPPKLKCGQRKCHCGEPAVPNLRSGTAVCKKHYDELIWGKDMRLVSMGKF